LTRIRALVVADEESCYIWDYFDRSVFQGVDVIISCGDLKASYLSFLTTMVAAPLLYVHGNHDARFLVSPPEGCDNLELKMHVIKGIRFLGFGGANSRSPKPFHYTEQEVARQVTRRMQEISFHGGLMSWSPTRPLLGWATGRMPSTRVLSPTARCWTCIARPTISTVTST